ncbi:MAG TPA: hypothetical protein VIR54_18140 [Vicinamibacterales bacterium]
MTVPLTHTAPRQIVAGDSIEFLVEIPSDYSGYTPSARITGPSTADATCTVEGSDAHVFLGSGDTEDLTAGQYALTVWLTSGARRKTLAQFPMSVSADLSADAPEQPYCVVMLAAIEAALKARLTGNADGGIEAYTTEGTSVTKLPTLELQRLRKQYAAEVARLQNPNGQIPRVNFAFSPAGSPVDLRRRFG